jgi:hypothetical protein
MGIKYNLYDFQLQNSCLLQPAVILRILLILAGRGKWQELYKTDGFKYASETYTR